MSRPRVHFVDALPTTMPVTTRCGHLFGDPLRCATNPQQVTCRLCAKRLTQIDWTGPEEWVTEPYAGGGTRTPATLRPRRERPMFRSVTDALTAWCSEISPAVRSPGGALVDSRIAPLQRSKPGEGAQYRAAHNVASVHLAVREVFADPSAWGALSREQAIAVVVRRKTRNEGTRELAAELTVTKGAIEGVIKRMMRRLRVELGARLIVPMPRTAHEYDAAVRRREELERRRVA